MASAIDQTDPERHMDDQAKADDTSKVGNDGLAAVAIIILTVLFIAFIISNIV